MANLFFIIVHILFIIFGLVGLVISIPLRLIYLNSKKSNESLETQTEILKRQAKVEKERQTVETLAKTKKKEAQTKCFYCAEMIKKEARVCKHCGRDVKSDGFDRLGLKRPR